MRALLLTTLLITACLSEDEISVSQSGDVIRKDLTNVNSHAYIEQGECLIDIKSSLDLNSNTSLPPLANSQCLPSSKLSWLFRAKKVEESIQAKQHMKLAVLLDTSSSLRDNDPGGERYKALRTYLLALFDKINSNDKGADALITSAEVQIYPFKYCDKRTSKVHRLTVAQSKSRSDFATEVDTLIGTNYTHKGKVEDVDKSFDKLTEYGAVGSTNYLHSLAKAIEFFDTAKADDLKQVLIFSDGLPFTFNDGTGNGANNTINLSGAECSVGHRYDYENLRAEFVRNSDKKFTKYIQACVTEEFYPKNTCLRPTGNNQGQTNTNTNEPKAWSDPLNHVLGMVQHRAVINKAKEDHNFQVYAVLLRPSNCDLVIDKWDNIICKEITAHLAKPFFESFANNYEEASKAKELAEKLEATLDAQTRRIDYRRYGKAYINTSSKASNTTEVDSSTKWYEGNLIKVGRDKKSDTVYEYKDNAQNTLTVNHGLYGRGGSFEIGYDFEFPEANSKGVTDCRSADNSKIGNLEVNKYEGSGYTAWCLLPPRCDKDDQCCDPSNDYQKITTEEGVQQCTNKGHNWRWSGYPSCDCQCDPAAKTACQGKGQSWNDATCSCDNAPVITPTECVPSATVCCKGGKEQAQPPCSGKAGEILDVKNCRCVSETSQPPPTSQIQQKCDSSRECCDGDTVMTSQSCSARQTWLGFPNCQCVRKTTTNPPIVVPPENPTQTNTGTMGGNEGNQGNMGGKEPENPEKNGKVIGEKGDPVPPTPLPNQGIVWGEFESF